MKLALTVIGTGSIILGLFSLFWFFTPNFSGNFEPPRVITVRAYLDNQCSVSDDVFVLSVPEKNRSAVFRGGVATMRLPEGTKIQLAVSSAYPAFRYDDIPQEVAPTVTLVADCSVSPRMKSIFGSMKEQFDK